MTFAKQSISVCILFCQYCYSHSVRIILVCHNVDQKLVVFRSAGKKKTFSWLNRIVREMPERQFCSLLVSGSQYVPVGSRL